MVLKKEVLVILMEISMRTEPYRFSDLVAYMPEHGDTKVAFNNGRSKVIAIALEAGQSLNEHKTPSDTFLLVVEGEIIFKMKGHDYRLKQGDAIDIPGNEPHSVNAVARSRFLLVH